MRPTPLYFAVAEPLATARSRARAASARLVCRAAFARLVKTYIAALSILVAALPAGVSSVQACGGGFPTELTLQRKQTLFAMSEGFFDHETGSLLPPPTMQFSAGLNSLSDEAYLDSDWGGAQSAAEQLNPPLSAHRLDFEVLGYSPAQRTAHAQARAASSGALAYAAGSLLPAAHRAYLAGAIAFRSANYPEAARYFAVVILAGDAHSNDRLLWALYMQGRTLHAMQGLTPAAEQSLEQLRELVSGGAADSLGLAFASLGEQARWHLRIPEPTALNYQKAAALYALQNAHVDAAEKGGETDFRTNPKGSLLFLARRIYQDEANLATALQDPLVNKLMLGYAFTRGNEIAMRDQARLSEDPEQRNGAFPDLADASIDIESAGMDGVHISLPLVKALQRAYESSGTRPDRVDVLAATLYRAGQFEAAAKFAALSEAPLAHWVRAKLALRAGDHAAASKAYAHAAKAFPIDESWLQHADYGTESLACRVRAENAVHALSRGEFLQTIALFSQSGELYEQDFAYVAERVLTAEELINYVRESDRGEATPKLPDPLRARARAILARRLLRGEKPERALEFFDTPELKSHAENYLNQLNTARTESGVTRAEALYRAGLIAREQGIFLLATELSPDNAWAGGSTHNYEEYDDAGNFVRVLDRPIDDKRIASTERALITEAEVKRFKSSAIERMTNYSYRITAAELLRKAASAVPERSQAYAALLCQAVGWSNPLDTRYGGELYLQYVNHGPYVPWAAEFGSQCEVPNFERAEQLRQQLQTRHYKRLAKRSAPWLLFSGSILVFLLAWRSRRAS